MREDVKRVWIANVPEAGEHSGATTLNCSMTDRKEAKRKGIEYSIACKKIRVFNSRLNVGLSISISSVFDSFRDSIELELEVDERQNSWSSSLNACVTECYMSRT